MSIRYNDQVREALAVIQNRHPLLNTEVFFVSGMTEGLGCACWPDEGGEPHIELSEDLPVGAIPEVLAHEFAHIVVGIDAGHGGAWEAEYMALMHDMSRAITGEELSAEELERIAENVAAAKASDEGRDFADEQSNEDMERRIMAALYKHRTGEDPWEGAFEQCREAGAAWYGEAVAVRKALGL